MSGGLLGAPLISGVGPFELPESIELTTDPDKMTYFDGDTIDLTGAVVQGKNADGTDWHPPRFIRWKNDPESVYKEQAKSGQGMTDLNNWIKHDMPNDMPITYIPEAIENRFTYTMQSGKYERMYYKVDVKPNTRYMFTIFIGGEFEEGIDRPGTCTRVGVCRYMMGDGYVEDMIDAESAIIVNRHFMSCDYNNATEAFMDFTTDADERITWVYLFIDFSAIKNNTTVSFRIRHIFCRPAEEESILWLQKPTVTDSPSELTDNYMLVSPGAWAYSIVDALHNHHLFMLSGNEFKVRILTSFLNTSPTTKYELDGQRELHSEPIVINGKTYHAVHYSVAAWTVSLFFVNGYFPKLPSDDHIYEVLSHYVDNEQPYEHYKLYTKKDLYEYLGVNDGNTSASELNKLLEGYIVDAK